jgi:hypothetical protein
MYLSFVAMVIVAITSCSQPSGKWARFQVDRPSAFLPADSHPTSSTLTLRCGRPVA